MVYGRLEYQRAYRAAHGTPPRNKIKWAEYMREYNRDPAHRLEKNLRTYLWKALKGVRRCDHLVDYLGCSIHQLMVHLEDQFVGGMSWENYGKWEVDHRVALTNGGSWHFSNLQPLWQVENAAKGGRLPTLAP